MMKWTKLGRVIYPALFSGKWWINDFIQSPSVLVMSDRIRLYFCSRNKPDAHGRYCSYVGYADLDLNDPTKIIAISDEPMIALGETGTFDEFGTYPVSAIRYNDEIRLYYGGITRCATVPFNAAIGCAISKDNGVTFTKFGPGPVISYSPDEPFVVGSPKVKVFNGKWHVWYASGRAWRSNEQGIQPLYKIRGAVSDDGINWKKIGRNLLGNVLEEDECQASGDVNFSGGKYHMLFSYRYNYGFKTPGRGYRTGYAWSDDLINWHRIEGHAGLMISDEPWENESVSYPNLFMLRNEWYAMYQCNGMGKEGIALAKLESPLSI
jgi:predicted GH43/DUF377 family glycosyl hydrolase